MLAEVEMSVAQLIPNRALKETIAQGTADAAKAVGKTEKKTEAAADELAEETNNSVVSATPAPARTTPQSR